MTVLFAANPRFPQEWRDIFAETFAREGIRFWPDEEGLETVETLILGIPAPEGLLARLPRLRLVSSVGMGVDHIVASGPFPDGVRVARVVQPEMVDQMAEYVALAVLRVERDSDRFDALQRERRWERRLAARPGGRLRVGILGMGAIGAECARRLTLLGFPVRGWSRRGAGPDGIAMHAGATGLDALLPQADILVCALPLTPETVDILGDRSFSRLPHGAHIVNIARGEHLDETALLAALDDGRIGGATLDVFRIEPLPGDHPFWDHPCVRVTPHSAGLSFPDLSAARILENIRRLRDGRPPENEVFPDRGY